MFYYSGGWSDNQENWLEPTTNYSGSNKIFLVWVVVACAKWFVYMIKNNWSHILYRHIYKPVQVFQHVWIYVSSSLHIIYRSLIKFVCLTRTYIGNNSYIWSCLQVYTLYLVYMHSSLSTCLYLHVFKSAHYLVNLPSSLHLCL